MLFSTFTSVVPLLVGICSAVPHQRRADTYSTLYAYGTNISGLAIYYGNIDGFAYISLNASSTLSALNWTLDTTSWTASFSNASSAGTFYIDNSTDAYSSTGFVTNTTSSNIVTTGFQMFGGQVVLNAGNMLESQFWAETTDADDTWALKWNVEGTSQVDSVPVVLKTLPPAGTTSS